MVQDKISVVIPVYNVVEYLDRCLTSVTKQTYQNLEIILINDGSTDGSKEKCDEWAKKDDRIFLISQANSGQGIARNNGIKIASGDYLAFVDADDWIELSMFEKMWRRIVEAKADIVICDIFHVICDEGKEVEYLPYKIQVDIDGVTNALETPEIIYRTDTCIYDKLYCLDFWREQNIEMPNHPYEDSVVVPLMMAMAKRVAYVPESLYYYNLYREGNTTSSVRNLPYIIQSLEELIQRAKDMFIFEKYRDAFMRYSIWMMRGMFFHLKKSRSEHEYQKCFNQTIPKMKDFLNQNYPKWNQVSDKKYLVWGSYNLRSVVMNLLVNPSDLLEHYGFSSVIGFSGEVVNQIDFKHSNLFRESMIKKEWNREFANRIKNMSEYVDYIFVDFLEERHDVIKFHGEYLTYSDAFKSAELKEMDMSLDILNKEENFKLWKKFVIEFFEVISKIVSLDRLVIVKNKLCERYGDLEQKKSFDELERIQEANRVLEEKYQFVLNKFQGIKVIEVNEKYIYTESSFVHGCKPEHMNSLAYWDVSDKIETYIKKQEEEK